MTEPYPFETPVIVKRRGKSRIVSEASKPAMTDLPLPRERFFTIEPVAMANTILYKVVLLTMRGLHQESRIDLSEPDSKAIALAKFRLIAHDLFYEEKLPSKVKDLEQA